VTERSWKAFERRCARDVGTERIPVTGERHGADAEDPMFCYQFKLGRSQPSYLREWLAGIVAAGAARRPGKVGVVVWKPKGARDGDALVLLRWCDWVALHGAVGAPVSDRPSCPAGGRQRGDALGGARTGERVENGAAWGHADTPENRVRPGRSSRVVKDATEHNAWYTKSRRETPVAAPLSGGTPNLAHYALARKGAA